MFVLLTQLGDYFPDWCDDISDIILPFASFTGFTNKDREKLFQQVYPNEMYELSPASDLARFTANDFTIDRDLSRFDFELLPATTTGDVHASAFRTRNVIPEVRILDTSVLMRKIAMAPGSILRTVLSPVSDDVANEVRTNVLRENHRLQQILDANCSVVDTRCFLGNVSQVPVGLKRVVTSMSTDSVLNLLTPEEVHNVWKNPLESVRGFSRLCTTAASFIRLPVLDEDNDDPATAAFEQMRAIIEIQDEFKEEVKREVKDHVMKSVHSFFDAHDRKVAEIIAEQLRAMQVEMLLSNARSAVQNHVVEKVTERTSDRVADLITESFGGKASRIPTTQGPDVVLIDLKKPRGGSEHSSASKPPKT
jgi:hypothetical protein